MHFLGIFKIFSARENEGNTLFWLSLFFFSLPVSKAVSSVSMVFLLILSLVALLKINFSGSVLFHTVLLSALFWGYVISLGYSEDKATGLRFLKSQLPLVIMPFVFFVHKNLILRLWTSLVSWFIAGVFLSAFCSIIISFTNLVDWKNFVNQYPDWFLPMQSLPTLKHGMYSPFVSKIQLANLASVGLVFSLFLTEKNRSVVWLTISLFLFAAVLLLGSSGSYIALYFSLFAGISFWIFTGVKFKKAVRLAFFFLFSLIYLFVFPKVVISTIPTVHARFHQQKWEIEMFRSGEFENYEIEHFTTINRYISWKNNFALFWENKFWGTGVGDYQKNIDILYENDTLNTPFHNHNQFLFIGASCGFLGLIFFLIQITVLTFNYVQNRGFLFPGMCFLIYYLMALWGDGLLLKQVDNMAFAAFSSFLFVLNQNR